MFNNHNSQDSLWSILWSSFWIT